MRTTFALLLTLSLTGCSSASLTGDGRKQGGEVPEAGVNPPTTPTTSTDDKPGIPVTDDDELTGTPDSGDEPPAVTETETDVPTECENKVLTTGVSDANGKLFTLIDHKLPYGDAVKACGAKGAKLIFAGQDLPDEILACRQALGVLWLRKSEGAALWQPEVLGEEARETPNWAICYR